MLPAWVIHMTEVSQAQELESMTPSLTPRMKKEWPNISTVHKAEWFMSLMEKHETFIEVKTVIEGFAQNLLDKEREILSYQLFQREINDVISNSKLKMQYGF